MGPIHAALREMLGANVGIGISDPQAADTDLWPEERVSVTRAIPKRRKEFAAGRRAVRAAMAELRLAPSAISQGRDRAPIWPTGLTGSIAHCESLCIAAVTHLSDYTTLGIDIEPATRLDPDLTEIICTASERDWIAQHPDPGVAAKLIFSAKEAVYKAQYPMTGQVIGFDAVTLKMTGDTFATTTLPNLKGAILIHDGLILSVAHV